ncbi:alpha/beta-hydrolase [Thozetella sp. PMI_491]|nr:alpha/beta-hydrolase [Thozetella sp. PMI_491]
MAPTSNKTAAPYGAWPSPITAELLSTSGVSLHEVLINEESGAIYCIESRPSEGGRFTIMEYREGGTREVLPSNLSAHGSVHELGGGSVGLTPAGRIILADDHTQNIYELDPASTETSLILGAEKGTHYADFSVHPLQSEWILAIKEDHRKATQLTQAYDVHNTLVAIDRCSSTEHTVASGDDFYAYPRFSPDGTHVCWVQWSHPDMPWTGTVLYIGEWENGTVRNLTRVAGEWRKESVSQPSWSPDGTLFFVSDKSGYWQLYTYSTATKSSSLVSVKDLEQSEFAIADWRLASSSYVFLDPQTIVASCVTHATSNIVLLNLTERSYRSLGLPYLDLAMSGTGVYRVSDDKVVVLGSTQTSSKELTLVSDVRSESPKLTKLRSTMHDAFAPGYLSTARHLEAPRSSRKGIVHAFYFAPQHLEYCGPPDVAPPCLIRLHGGPNACMSPSLDLSTQFWTSRGFAVCAVNYAGSTGFGREYREELTGHWGLYDVHDTHDVVKYLVEQRLADGARVGVYGQSAGGYGTLSAIHMFPAAFAAAVSSYGICDVRALQADSYKFESQDVERLILSSCNADDSAGRAQLLKERSPRFFVDRITAPLLVLQGTDDNVVTPEQAHMMAAEMNRQGRTVKVVEFEGEGHGWLKEGTILQAYQEQEIWWRTHLLG